MPFKIKTTPKIREVKKVKDVLLKEPKEIEPKKLYFAAGGGSIPPNNNNNDKTIFKKNISPEEISKIMELIGNTNKINLNKNYYNKFKN